MQMKDFEDQILESDLREHLAAELDTQLGRSKRAFREYIVRTRVSAPDVIVKTSTAAQFRAKFWTLTAAGAIAAGLAAFWAVPLVMNRGNTTAINDPTHAAPAAELAAVTAASPTDDAAGGEWEEVEKVVSTMTVDDGLVIIDDRTPARLIRRVEMERMQWFDQRRGMSLETVVPRENVQLITLDTY